VHITLAQVILCEVCNVSCCGSRNFEQHCRGRSHLSAVRAAAEGLQAPAAHGGPPGSPTAPVTYVGPEAATRSYCQQVHTL